ncbi:MAG: hypothetical protein M0Z37_08745 [Nitrospiraceae bacterium]|nr:hypothetical protein [Nitrospiraceae bacterium]
MARFGPTTRLPYPPPSRYNSLCLLTSERRRMFFSTCHPVSFFLNARGIDFSIGSWLDRPFLLAESSGYHWLPFPPEWTLYDHDSENPFWAELSDWLFKLNDGLPGRVDNLPLGIRCLHSPASPPTLLDTERILLREPYLLAAGNRYKSHRWELNRLLRIDPDPGIRIWSDLSPPPGKDEIKSRFFEMRRKKARNEMDWLMVDDLEQAHLVAESQWKDLSLTGIILSLRGEAAAWQWLALSESGKNAVCFLECRDPEVGHVSAMMTRLAFQQFPDLEWINIGGDSGLPGLALAKDQDHPAILVPEYSQNLAGG